MEYLLIIVSILLAFVGVLGAVLPMLPGSPLSFLGLLLLSFCDRSEISTATLWISGVFMVVVTLFDYLLPIWFTNLSKGSPNSTRGATAGMLLGLFFPPWGLVFGPLLGAFVGELLATAVTKKAIEVAMMSFLGFLATTGTKLIYGLVLFFMVLMEAFDILWV